MIKKYFINRKFRWMTGIILAMLQLAISIWPVGFLKEDMHFYLKGFGKSEFGMSEAPTEYYQYVKPAHQNLESIDLFFICQAEELHGDGLIEIKIVSEEDEVFFEKQLTYAEVKFDEYFSIPVSIKWNRNSTYIINVSCTPDSSGNMVTLGYCTNEEQLKENQSFWIKRDNVEHLQDRQLLIGYTYKDAIDSSAAFKVLIIAIITMLGIGIGLPDKKFVKIIVGLFLVIAAPWILGQRLELLTIDTNFLLPNALLWNCGIMLILEVIVLLCTCSFRWSIVLTNSFLGILYTVNYFVLMYRGVPLKLNDFMAIGTAAEVVGGYDFTPNKHLTMIWCLLVAFVVYGWQCGNTFSVVKCIKEKHILKVIGFATSFVAGIVLCVGMFYNLLCTDLLVENGFVKFSGFDQQMIYHFNGYIVSCCIDIQASRVYEPEGYSEERVKQIMEEIETVSHAQEDAEELPHIILIMNESFSDLRLLGDLEISQENMGFFYSLEENTIRGIARTSVLGGGTANSEFEVFTGASLGLLPSSYYGYQQGMYKERNSLISLMKEAGYSTYSIHPEPSKNWNRDSVYKKLGFDYSYWKEDFDEECTHIHNGISDLDTYYMVEEVFENLEPGEKMFLFDLTMQNHGGYGNSSIERTVTSVNVACPEADVYLSAIKKSDEAFEHLINYFSNVDEKVMICMYGDHQPSFSDESFKENLYEQTEGLDEIDKILNPYKVPFIIWANYDMEEKQDYDISLNYLGAFLAKTAGVPLNPFFDFLNYYMEKYPMITVNGYKDAAGNYYSWSGKNDELIDYRILQYNYMFDNDIVTQKK